MQSIYVKPVAGARIRQPERSFELLPAEGALVPYTTYWALQLNDGSVERTEPPPKKSAA